MSISEIDPLLDPRWKAFVAGHPNASVFHRVEWLEALKSCYGYRPRALTCSPPETSLESGFLFCEVRSPLTGNRLVSLPFSDHCEPLLSQPEQMPALLEALAERAHQHRWKYFEIRPVCANLSGSETRLGISSTYCFHRVDLRRSEEVIFKSLHKDCIQRKIRRAEREGLRYESGSSATLLKHFYKMLIMTRRRQSVPPQPLKWFQSLITALGSDLKIHVAFKGDTPIASILTICDRKTMVYKYGCSDTRFNNLGGTPMLFWNAMQDAKRQGIEVLDLGRSDIDNDGLIAFKGHLGGEKSVLNYWRYPAPPVASKASHTKKYAQKLIAVAPDISLVMLGNLLYRHIG
jgi:CelD/BcsL family acetyltransferase involved in cellulose biosynthesis